VRQGHAGPQQHIGGIRPAMRKCDMHGACTPSLGRPAVVVEKNGNAAHDVSELIPNARRAELK
jgi:hypothetical protein